MGIPAFNTLSSKSKSQIVNAWGERAYELLMQIQSPHAQKKRTTLLALANQRMLDAPLGRAFKYTNTGAEFTHYTKWMKKDAAYKAAYDFLIGEDEAAEDSDGRGLATKYRDLRREIETREAVGQLSKARRTLNINAHLTIGTLVDLMSATRPILVNMGGDTALERVPDNAARVKAASKLADLAGIGKAAEGVADVPTGVQMTADEYKKKVAQREKLAAEALTLFDELEAEGGGNDE